jgi:hypothetical protein
VEAGEVPHESRVITGRFRPEPGLRLILDNSDQEYIVCAMAATITTTAEGKCPVCRAKVVARSEGDVVIHNAILKVESASGRVAAKCARCKSWLEVPLRYVAE